MDGADGKRQDGAQDAAIEKELGGTSGPDDVMPDDVPDDDVPDGDVPDDDVSEMYRCVEELVFISVSVPLCLIQAGVVGLLAGVAAGAWLERGGFDYLLSALAWINTKTPIFDFLPGVLEWIVTMMCALMPTNPPTCSFKFDMCCPVFLLP